MIDSSSKYLVSKDGSMPSSVDGIEQTIKSHLEKVSTFNTDFGSFREICRI